MGLTSSTLVRVVTMAVCSNPTELQPCHSDGTMVAKAGITKAICGARYEAAGEPASVDTKIKRVFRGNRHKILVKIKSSYFVVCFRLTCVSSYTLQKMHSQTGSSRTCYLGTHAVHHQPNHVENLEPLICLCQVGQQSQHPPERILSVM